MPERPRVHRYSEQKRRATTLFVDRSVPQALFRSELDLLVDARSAPSLLTFYGLGGQGKTALCRQLVRIAFEADNVSRGIRCALIDLQLDNPAGEWHAFVAIRNAVAAATGAAFPCFDLAFADFWSRAAPHQPAARLGGTRLTGFGADASETVASSVAGIAKDGVLAALDGWGKTVADVTSEVAGGLPFVGPLLKRTSNWAIAAGYQALLKRNAAALEALYGTESEPAAAIILAHLPDILAHELALHLRTKKQHLVLLIDEYERAMLAGGSEGVVRSDPWDQGLRAFYASCALGEYLPGTGKTGYRYDVPMMLVLFGREKIRWDEIDSSWKDDLEGRQHLLDGLATEDAEHFLIEAGVGSADIRTAIVQAATAHDSLAKAEAAYPLMLDMSVQLYYDMLAGGEQPQGQDFQLVGATYTAKRGELLQRILRRYPIELHGLLRRLACAREFDREIAAALVRAFNLPFDMIRFADLGRLSFMSCSDDGLRLTIHSHIRDTLIASLPPQDLHETRAMLADLFCMRATPESRRFELRHARAYVEAIRLHAEGRLEAGILYLDPRAQLFNSKLYSGTLVGVLRQSVAIERSRNENWDRLVEALYRLAWVQAPTHDADEAVASVSEAIALLSEHAGADRERLSRCIYLLATAHYALGHHDETLAAFEKCLEIRQAIYPADSDMVIATASGVATGLLRLGRSAEALAVNESLLERVRAIDPNHALIAQLAYNLGVSNFWMGRMGHAKEAFEVGLCSAERHMLDDDPLIARIVSNLGLILIDENNFDAAEALFRRSLAIVEKNGLPASPYTFLGLAKVHRSRGEFQAALDAIRAVPTNGLPSEKLADDAVFDAAYIEVQALAACGHREAAIARCDEAIVQARARGSLHKLSDLLGLRGEFNALLGEVSAAIECYSDQLAVRRGLFAAPSIWNARPLRELGRLHLAREELGLADAYLKEASEQFLGAVGSENLETREVALIVGLVAYFVDDPGRAFDVLMPQLDREPATAMELVLFRNGWTILSGIYAARGDPVACVHAEQNAAHFDAMLAPETPRMISLEDLRESNRANLAEAGIGSE